MAATTAAISSPSKALTTGSTTSIQPDGFRVSAKSGVAMPAATMVTRITSQRVNNGLLVERISGLQESVARRTPPHPAWWEGRPNKKAM